MAQLNHTIVWCIDKRRSADFLTDILGAPPARPFLHFLVVELENGVSLDYFEKSGSVSPQHYAFLVSDAEFDAAFGKIQAARHRLLGRPGTVASRVRSTLILAGAASISPTPTSI